MNFIFYGFESIMLELPLSFFFGFALTAAYFSTKSFPLVFSWHFMLSLTSALSSALTTGAKRFGVHEYVAYGAVIALSLLIDKYFAARHFSDFENGETGDQSFDELDCSEDNSLSESRFESAGEAE